MNSTDSTLPEQPLQTSAPGVAGSRIRASDVSIVIATIGRPSIVRCLASIRSSSVLPAWVIVADQGASSQVEDSLSSLSEYEILTRYLPLGSKGKSIGLNAALRTVDTPFVLITDDDCEVGQDWLGVMAEHLRSRPDVIVTGGVRAGGDQPVLNVVEGTETVILRKPGLIFDRLSGGNLGFSIEALAKVGLFDEDPCVRYAEDSEWAYRALRSGASIAYLPTAMVTHLGWRKPDARLQQYRGYARCHAAFFGKYLRHGDLFIAVRATIHAARALLRWLRGLVRGDRELAANGRAYVSQFIPGIIEGMRSRVLPPTLP